MTERSPQPGGVRLRRRLAADRGSAVVEFVALSVLMLVPTLYLVIALGQVQGASFAVASIGREVARIHATDPSGDRAAGRATAATALILADHGLQADPGRIVTVRCSADPCRSPDARIDVDVDVHVPLPLLGSGVLGSGPLGVSVETRHSLLVEPFLEGPAGSGGPGAETETADGDAR